MRFKELTIHNIASIADTTINFDQKPLSNESLFLICGETGAGKTTLLDAICLALYKTTPRIEQSKSGKYIDESLKNIDKGENVGIKVSDPRQYLRRGAAEGFVHLTYLGNNGEKCAVRIEFGIVERSQNLKDIIWELQVDDAIYTKKEIEPQIKATIGFDFNQFCRTTMLAQGEFTRFLKSKEEEKADILEKLTGTEIYTDIGRRIFETTNVKKQVKEKVKITLDAVNLLDDESLQKLREDVERLEIESNKQKAILDVLDKQKTWLEKEAELVETEKKASESVVLYKEQSGAQQVIDARKTVTEWRSTEKERQAVVALRNLAKQREQIIVDNEKLESEFARLTAGELYRNAELDGYIKDADCLKADLEKEQPFVAMYDEKQLIISGLNRYVSSIKEAGSLAENAKKVEERLPQCKELCEQRKNELQTISENLEKQTNEIRRKQEQLDAMNHGQLAQKLQLLNEQQDALNKVENRIEARNNSKKEQREAVEKVKDLEQVLNQQNEALSELTPKLEETQRLVEQAKSLFEKTKLSVGDYAKSLRHGLSEGDTCPVCGNMVTTIEHDAAFEQALKPVQDDYEAKQKQLDKLKDAQRSISAELKSQQKLFDEAKKLQVQKQQAYQECAKALADACKIINLKPDNDSLSAQVVDSKQKNNTEISQVKQQYDAANTLQTEINAMNNTKDNISKSEKNAQKLLSEAEKQLSDLDYNIKNFNDLSQQKSTDAQKALADVANKICYSDDWQANIEQTIGRLTQDAERYNILLERERQLLDSIGKIKEAQERSFELCEQVRQLFPQWAQSSDAQQVSQLDSAWTKLLTDASQLRTQITENERQTKENQSVIDSLTGVSLAQLEALANLTPEKIAGIEARLSAIDKQLQSAQGALEQVKLQRKNHLEAKPEMDENVSIDSLKAQLDSIETALTENSRKLGEVSIQIKANEINREDFAKKKAAFEQAEAEWGRWESLLKLFGDSEGKKFRVIAQSFVLRELLSHANTFLRQFSDRYELTCPNSLTILVRDLHAGGVSRPVDLVSGGESFIISLALALGLSSLNRNSLSADILFIDEGFGTLDPVVLEEVMGALGRLQAFGNRRVGIISHVEALRERIPVKILVERVDNCTSRAVVHQA